MPTSISSISSSLVVLALGAAATGCHVKKPVEQHFYDIGIAVSTGPPHATSARNIWPAEVTGLTMLSSTTPTSQITNFMPCGSRCVRAIALLPKDAGTIAPWRKTTQSLKK